MEQVWTKRKLASLAQGDLEAVRQWQTQFGRFIYTWFYFQINKDESQAALLTGQTLTEGLLKLAGFEPDRTTMYLWLKELAGRHLQTAALQRPAGWSEIPPRILESLKRFRNEPLSAEVPACGAVIEIVQAALADLPEQDRDLLVRRYTRLDTADLIAADLNVTSEKVNQQLYMARHAFRRGVFYLLQSANSDVIEPTGTGGLEVFESNLEMLMRSLNSAVTISSDYAEQIKRTVLQAASDVAQNPPVLTAGSNRKKMVAVLAVIAAALLIAAAVMVLSAGRDPQTPSSSPAEPQTPPATTDTTPPAEQDQDKQATLEKEELSYVIDIGRQGDVKGLLAVLDSGSFFAQVLAAHYLGQVGDASVIAPLEQAELRWFAEGPAENPFALALLEIEDRLNPVKPAEPAQTPPVPQEEAAQTPDKQPPLSGRVTDVNGAPLAGVHVSVLKNDPAAMANSGSGLSATTDQEGQYAFENVPSGMCVVIVQDPQRRLTDSRHMIWPVSETPCTLDFGGQNARVVRGTLMSGGSPMVGQTLLMSDNFSMPEEGVFTAQVQTGSDGGFYVSGAPSGLYGLFVRSTTNRWSLFGQVEVGGADLSVLLNQPTVTLVVQAGQLPEGLSIVSASLRYGPDSPDALTEWTAVRTEIETVFEIHGILPGSYTVCADFSNRVRVFRDVVVDQQPEQFVLLDEIPVGSAGLSGRFLSPWPEGLTLACAAPPMRISVMAGQDSLYTLSQLPPAMYSMGMIVNHLFVPCVEFGLFEDQPAVFDPDPLELSKSRSPLYVYLTDSQGRGVSGDQVWLTGQGGVYTAVPLGRGFFVAAPPGEYMLNAAASGYSPQEKAVVLSVTDIRTAQNKDNTQVMRLSR